MEPIDPAFRNRFTVAAGHFRTLPSEKGQRLMDVNYVYKKDFETLSEALNVGLPAVHGHPIQELTYVDAEGQVWELDAVKQRDPEEDGG